MGGVVLAVLVKGEMCLDGGVESWVVTLRQRGVHADPRVVDVAGIVCGATRTVGSGTVKHVDVVGQQAVLVVLLVGEHPGGGRSAVAAMLISHCG